MIEWRRLDDIRRGNAIDRVGGREINVGDGASDRAGLEGEAPCRRRVLVKDRESRRTAARDEEQRVGSSFDSISEYSLNRSVSGVERVPGEPSVHCLVYDSTQGPRVEVGREAMPRCGKGNVEGLGEVRQVEDGIESLCRAAENRNERRS